jgi:glycosyltransferase involved in cell wall biosynthesis
MSDDQRAGEGIQHLMTPEYPPESGGVGDYARQVAEYLGEAGQEIHVWCRPSAGAGNVAGYVHIHRELGSLSPGDLRRVGDQLNRFPAPRRILVQWVPHGFGYRSMNLPFVLWLWHRARNRGDKIEIMVHEAFLDFEGTWRQYAAALVHRLMTIIMLRVAERVWVAIPKWEQLWRPFALGRRIPFQWLPLPSNVPVARDAEGVAALRCRYVGEDGLLLGHFGTFGKAISDLLEVIIVRVLDENAKAAVILIGPGAQFLSNLLQRHPRLAGRIHTTGALSASDPLLSLHISACDVIIQPYPDGASSRRTSLMAGLSHAKAIVTTVGPGTEDLWVESNAVAVASTADPERFARLVNRLCADARERARLGQAAGSLYRQRFDIAHIVAKLRASYLESTSCVS